jgi:hypothetical protein
VFNKGEIMAPAAPKKLDQDVTTGTGSRWRYIFLAVAARKLAGYWSGGNIELEEWAVQQWAVWYKVELRSNDVTSFNS